MRHGTLERHLAAMVAIGLIAAATVCAAPRDGSVMVFPSGARFTLEIAEDEETRALGYMYRTKIPDDEGMLFLFAEDARHGFWMKNCLVALDLIWLDADLQVVHVAERLQPCPPTGACPLVRPMRSARYVLEVAAGTAEREGLQLGDRLERRYPDATQ